MPNPIPPVTVERIKDGAALTIELPSGTKTFHISGAKAEAVLKAANDLKIEKLEK